MKKRRKSREEALRMLFQFDATGDPLEEIIGYYWESFSQVNELEVREYADHLFRGTVAHLRELDDKIQDVSTHWNMSRMFMVDKNILRLALFEMMLQREVPPAAVTDAPLDLSKVYGTESSPKFINGILDALAKREKLK